MVGAYMPKPRSDPVPPSRYSQAAIGLEIRQEIARRRERGLHTRVAEYLGLTSQQLTHRLSDDHKLTIEMCGAIADKLEAPFGWPFVPYRLAEDKLGKPPTGRR